MSMTDRIFRLHRYSCVANLKNASYRRSSRMVSACSASIEYNLIERTTERELIPMANKMGLGVVPWSPLASGLLSGKYSKKDFLNKSGSTGFQGSRKNAIETLGKFTQRNMQIVDEVKEGGL
jgi:aryl-alcohol dehydrogenase-like predicted oxidoreductase